MRSSRTRLIAASILAIALVVLASGCSRKPVSSGSGLTPAEKAAAVDAASATASDAVAVKNGTSTGTTGTTVTKGSSTAAGATGTGTTGGSTGTGAATKPSTGTKPVAKPSMKVLIMFWNDTSSKALKGTEIMIGSSAFKPKTTANSDQGTIVGVPYGQEVMIVVYPDGRGGKRITVPLTVNKEMLPSSEQDAIHVAISDGSVRVLGNPINNVDRIIPRF